MIELSLVIIGVVFFVLAILNYKQIFGIVPDPSLMCKWKIIFYMTIFFLIGYLHRIYQLVLVFPKTIDIMIGLVYCFGAVYVYTVTLIGYRTIKHVKKWKKNL